MVGLALVLALPFSPVRSAEGAPDPVNPIDTQSSGRALAPTVALRKMQVPEGFKVTLAAAEPGVRQPIAINYDDRGRLWVAESYSYDGSDFTEKREDRILSLIHI
mgnify:CR=1 FL=1